MQTPLEIVPIFMKDAHSAESNEKSILRYIYFYSCGWLYLKYTGDTPRFSSVSQTKKIVQKWSNLQERFAMSWNEWKINFAIFIFWVMVDFVLKFIVNWLILGTKTTIYISKTKNW